MAVVLLKHMSRCDSHSRCDFRSRKLRAACLHTITLGVAIRCATKINITRAALPYCQEGDDAPSTQKSRKCPSTIKLPDRLEHSKGPTSCAHKSCIRRAAGTAVPAPLTNWSLSGAQRAGFHSHVPAQMA